MQRKLKETSFMCDFSGHLSMCGEMTLDLKVQGSRSLCVCVFVCVCVFSLLACVLACLVVCVFVCLLAQVRERNLQGNDMPDTTRILFRC